MRYTANSPETFSFTVFQVQQGYYLPNEVAYMRLTMPTEVMVVNGMKMHTVQGCSAAFAVKTHYNCETVPEWLCQNMNRRAELAVTYYCRRCPPEFFKKPTRSITSSFPLSTSF